MHGIYIHVFKYMYINTMHISPPSNFSTLNSSMHIPVVSLKYKVNKNSTLSKEVSRVGLCSDRAQ